MSKIDGKNSLHSNIIITEKNMIFIEMHFARRQRAKKIPSITNIKYCAAVCMCMWTSTYHCFASELFANNKNDVHFLWKKNANARSPLTVQQTGLACHVWFYRKKKQNNRLIEVYNTSIYAHIFLHNCMNDTKFHCHIKWIFQLCVIPKSCLSNDSIERMH